MTAASDGSSAAGIGQQYHPSSQHVAAQIARLVLASGSPRRQELLRAAGYRFVVDPADIDESDHPNSLSSAELVLYLAQRKAAHVARRHPAQVVLAADTVVALGNDVLGKPEDAAHANVMLRNLSGTSHDVWTGVAVHTESEVFTACVRSVVHMRDLSAEEITLYVAGGEWRGKAGGYGIQDPDPFVTRIAGSETNIVGLPLDETRALLSDAGVYPDSSIT